MPGSSRRSPPIANPFPTDSGVSDWPEVRLRLPPFIYNSIFKGLLACSHGSKQAVFLIFIEKLYIELQSRLTKDGRTFTWDLDTEQYVARVLAEISFVPPGRLGCSDPSLAPTENQFDSSDSYSGASLGSSQAGAPTSIGSGSAQDKNSNSLPD